MTKDTLLALIALRGMREQALKFAVAKYKGGMKQCYTKGCEIFTPLHHAIKDLDLSQAMKFDQMHNGEIPVYID